MKSMKKSLLALCFATALFTGNENIQAQETNKLVGAVQKIPDKYELLTKKFEDSLDMAQTNKQGFRFLYKDPVRVVGNYTDTDKPYLRGFEGNGVSCRYIPNWTNLSFDDGTNHITFSGDVYGQWVEHRGIIREEGDVTKVEFETPREIPRERAENLLRKFKLLSDYKEPDNL